jgi:hypothetical protein
MGTAFLTPFSLNNQTIFYSELKVKYLKVIYKALLGDVPDANTIFKNLNNILHELTNIDIHEIEKLNVIDYFNLLLDIRITSVGSSVFVEVPDLVNTKIELNLNNFCEKLNNTKQKYHDTKDCIEDFIIKYRLPTLRNIIKLNSQTTSDELYSIFIDSITYRETKIDFTKLNLDEIQLILNHLPAKITSNLYKKIYTLITEFNSINLLPQIKELEGKSLTFNLNVNNLIILLKIIFGDELMSLYDNIFWLSKFTHFTPEYIENLTPGEYVLYVKKVQAINSTDKSPSDNTDMTNFDDSIDDFS